MLGTTTIGYRNNRDNHKQRFFISIKENVKMPKFMSLLEIIEQIESCAYECEAGTLENNLAWVELRQMAGLDGGCQKPAVWTIYTDEPSDTLSCAQHLPLMLPSIRVGYVIDPNDKGGKCCFVSI